MKFLYLFIVVLYAQSSFAVIGDFSCPETHPEYTRVLSELKSFKDKLASNLECKEISVKLDELTNLLSGDQRVDFRSLINSGANGTLSADSAKKVQDYASSVTEEVGTLIALIGAAASGGGSFLDIFTGTDKCSLEPEDELEGIERLTKAAYEATNLVSRVAGPYGVPLQVGANAVYGIVEGLKSYSERTKHINFNSFEKREFFESAICLMSKFDSDIRKLNNPRAHLGRLEQARAQAIRVVDTVSINCEGCDNSKMRFVSAQVENGKKNLEWIDEEITKFHDIVKFKTGGIGPAELEGLRARINKFLIEVAAPDFIDWYSDRLRLTSKNIMTGVRAAQVEMFHSFQDNTVPWSRVVPSGVRSSQVSAVPELADLYYMKINYKNFSDMPFGSDLSSSYHTLLGEAYDTWKLSDLNLRIIQEYCEFFEATLQYRKPVQKACENLAYTTTSLRVSYAAFYLADLINKNSRMQVIGPFDFRLEKHIAYIPRYAKLRGRDFVLARNGIDLGGVLGFDRSIRLADGRLDNESTEKSVWWMSLRENADNVIKKAQNFSDDL